MLTIGVDTDVILNVENWKRVCSFASMLFTLIALSLILLMSRTESTRYSWANLGGINGRGSSKNDRFDKFRHSMKVKWSGLGMTDGSGKIGGNVAAKNRFGNYLRRKGQVLNPQTVAQQAIRMAFGALSQAWRALTDAQRAGWRALANFVTINDQFGDGYSPTGAQLYNRLNSNLSKVAHSAIDDAPVLVGAAQLDIPIVVFDIGTGDALELTVPYATNGTEQQSDLYVEATPPVSAGRTEGSIKNLFRGINMGAALPNQVPLALPFPDASPFVNTDTDFTAGIAENYVTIFGMPAAGQKIFWRFSAINQVTGESSPIIMASSIVIDTP